VTVTIPLTGSSSFSGTVDVATTTATSTFSNAVFDLVTDTTTVGAGSAGVSLEPDNAQTAAPANEVVYTHVLTNLSNFADTFIIAATNSAGWAVSPVGPISLGPGEATSFAITVTVPAMIGAQVNTTTVTATSSADSAVFDTAVDVTTVTGPVPGVSLEPDNQAIAGVNTTISYQHTITNEGNSLDSFSLEANSSQGWAVSTVPSQTIQLTAGQTGTVFVNITVPAGAGGLIDTTTVTATSALDSAVFDNAVNTTTISQTHALELIVADSSAVVSDSTIITYTYQIINQGNGSESLTVTVSSSLGWPITAPANITVGAGMTQTMVITVMVPIGSGGLTNVTTVTLTSVTSPAIQVSAVSTVTVPLARSLRLVADQTGAAPPNSTLVYTHHLTNSGNSGDTFEIALSQTMPWATVDVTNVSLAAGESAPIAVTVTIPASAPSNTTHVVTMTASSSFSPTVARGAVVDVTTVRETVVYLPLIFKLSVTTPPTPTPTPVPPTPTPTPVTPEPGVDLVVTDLVIEPSTPISGELATVYVTVENQGAVPVSFGNNFFIDFHVDPVITSTLFGGDLAWSVQGVDFGAGVSQTFSGTHVFSGGRHELYVSADTQNNVAEVNETNNLLGPVTIIIDGISINLSPEPGPALLPDDIEPIRPTATPRPNRLTR